MVSGFPYEIAVLSVWWEVGGEDVRLFTTPTEREAYFSALNLKFSPAQNIVINDGNDVTCVLNLNDGVKNGADIQEILNYNYAVLRYEDGGGNIIYRYYFASLTQISGRQFSVDLTLDDITTTYTNIRNADCLSPILADRVHLDRWKDWIGADVTQVEYVNGTIDSPFHSSDSFPDVAVLEKMYNVNNWQWTGSSVANDNINKYLASGDAMAWLYVFFQPYGDLANIPNGTLKIADINYSNIMCICVPILTANAGNTSYITAEVRQGIPPVEVLTSYVLGANAIEEMGIDTARILNTKVTPVTPFSNMTQSTEWDSSSRRLTLIFSGYTTIGEYTYIKDIEGRPVMLSKLEGIKPCAFLVTQLPETVIADITEIDVTYSLPYSKFNLSMAYNYKNNPLLYKTPLRKIILRDYAGNPHEYDPLGLNATKIQVALSEPISPDITRGFFRIQNFSKNAVAVSSLYNDSLPETYNGLTYSIDTSYPYRVDALESFLASNKNFFLSNIVSGAASTAAGIGYSKTPGVNTLFAVSNIVDNMINMSFALDNYKNAPDTYNNTGGNIFLNLSVLDQLKYTVEIWSAPEIIQQKVSAMCFKYGYQYSNDILLNEYDNTRYYFNYIKTAEPLIFCMPMPLNSASKSRLSAIFQRGVRLWHVDNMSTALKYDNIERRFINETTAE